MLQYTRCKGIEEWRVVDFTGLMSILMINRTTELNLYKSKV